MVGETLGCEEAKRRGVSSEPSMDILNDYLKDNADAQPTTVYCHFCPEWSVEGTAAETRTAAEQHRREHHPEVLSRTRLVRKRRAFSQTLTQERKDEIDEERRQRMRSLGIG